jgi:A/G-specific adenine glycosylase
MEQNKQESGEVTEEILKFRTSIYRFYKSHGRTFPWRDTDDPWLILLSEMMLQQTQTSRVAERWPSFIASYPDPASMNRAGLDQILRSWSGLGYNRRALALKKIAAHITAQDGRFPDSYDELISLPMIGPYTAKAILAFAWHRPVVFIETNIRRVFIHHFFEGETAISDSQLLPYVEKSLDREDPKSWYYALMDYGAWLKGKVENPNRRSAHYTVQAPFKGSVREKRGKILKLLSGLGSDVLAAQEINGVGGVSITKLAALTDMDEESCRKIMSSLEKEEFVCESEGCYRIRR